jgi:hypothetical protein
MAALSMSQAEITHELSTVARMSVADAAVEIKAASRGLPAIVKVDLGPKVKALETLARINGMIVDKQRVEQSNDIRIIIEHADQITDGGHQPEAAIRIPVGGSGRDGDPSTSSD